MAKRKSNKPSNVANLIKEARALKPKPPYVGTWHYAETIAVLKDQKGFTWKEVCEWLAERGVTFSTGSIMNAYKQRGKKK